MTSRRRKSRSRSRPRRSDARNSRSRSRKRGSRASERPRIPSVDNKFHVPYRCLIPPDAAGSIIGKSAVLLRDLVDETGVEVQVLRPDENPLGLEDRIVILNGPHQAKDDALAWLLNRLREHFNKRSDDNMTFVSFIPMSISSVIIGNKGSTIRDLTNQSGAEIGISKERVRDTPDAAVTLRGRPSGIVRAMSLIHRIVQNLHDRGELRERDFEFCNIFPSQVRKESRAELPPEVPDDHVSGLDVRLVVSTAEADFLTSKSGGMPSVQAIEKNHNCLVTVEDLSSPEEMIVISAKRYRDKVDGVMGTLKILNQEFNNRVTSFLLETEIKDYVLRGVESISHSTGCVLKSHQGGANTVIEFSGEFEKQMKAIALAIGRIDSSSKLRKPTEEVDRKVFSLVVSARGLSEGALSEIHGKSKCRVERRSDDLVNLTGQKHEILKAVEELLNHAPLDKDEPMTIDEEQRRRHRSVLNDDDVDYS